MVKAQVLEKNIFPQKENRILNYILYLSFLVLLVFFSITKISGEDDYFWHIASGRYIAEHISVPSTDVFGYVTYGQPWIPFEWGWDVITYLIFNLSGYTGIYVFKVLLILLIFLLFYKILDKFNVSVSIKIVFLLIFCWGTLFRFSIRPHLISYLCFVILLNIIISYKYFNRKNHKILYYLPVIFLLWANFHMGVIAGILLLSVFLINETIIYFLPKRFLGIHPFGTANEIPPLSKNDLLRLVILFVVSLAVLFANPNHINTFKYVYSFSQLKLVKEIGEWKSPFDSSYSGSLAMIVYKIYLGLGVFALYYSYKKKDLLAFLIVVTFALYSLRATRFTTIAF